MHRPIPVVIVAGYLGSGKTTLLNHLLRNNAGTRIGVVVNDFGSINIDSMLVAGQVDSMVSLGNGCLCCAVDVSDMDELFGKLAQPGADIDVIVVEASGLAEPKNLVRLVLGSENPHIGFGGLVEVVDAAGFDDTRRRHPEIDQHLRLADLVVVNKADLLASEALSTVVDTVRRLVGVVPIVATSDARVDPQVLFDRPDREPDAQLTLDRLLLEQHHEAAGHRHLHDDYESISFATAERFDPRAFLDLFEDPPEGLFRAKGVVRFAVADERRAFEVHAVGRHITVAPQRRSVGETQVVLIGMGMDGTAIRRRLHAAEHAGEPLDADALLPLWRYVRD